MSYWDGYFLEDYSFADFSKASRVLDVGFGEGDQMDALRASGIQVSGVDFSRALVEAGKARGLDVAWAPAEKLPHADSSFDGLICKVVLPYTDESVAIREWGRVLREGGQVRASYHGAGYFLRYALAGADWKERVYGVRSIVNGWLYAISGKRLPGFMGDTIYQSESRLRRHYASSKLELDASFLGRSYLGFPVFIYHSLRRSE